VAFPKTEFRRALTNWYRKSGRDLPWRRTRDAYAVLVSEFMLQQTQVSAVIPYYNDWTRRFPDFGSLSRASENDVLHAWQGLGYYTRARNLHATAKIVVAQHDGRLPRSVLQIRQLPGIGKYTAHAVATFAFNRSLPIVEANTARVLTRLFNFQNSIDSNAARDELWRKAAMLVPKRNARIYNSALTDLGALICIPRDPKCGICPVKKFCRAKRPQTLPVQRSRPGTKRSIEAHAFIASRARILLEQSATRWRGMWILPPLELDGLNPSSFAERRIHVSVFPFTYHKITLVVYSRCPPKRIAPTRRWFAISSLRSVPIPSPHRRAVESIIASQAEQSSRYGCNQ
jgi:A/G-specific adenine glycosylase